MATCLVALGSNLGNRVAVLERAIELLSNHPAITLAGHSRWFHTEPIGGPQGQGGFVNAAIRLVTSCSPEEMLAILQSVEADLGRQRRERWSARTVDLDLLLFDDVILKTPQLQIPHPRMVFRRFVLEPAAEIAPDMRHPVNGWTIGKLLDHLNRAVNYVALTGPPAAGKTDLARRVAKSAAVRLIGDVSVDVLRAADAMDAESSPFSLEIKLLDQRSELLATSNWPEESTSAISDFWIGQCVAYSRIRAEVDRLTDIEAAWRTVRNRILTPKLLVLMTAPSEWLTQENAKTDRERSSAVLRDRLDRLQSELRRVAFHARQGPVLELDASQPEWALTELTAAIEAMK